MYTYHGPRQTYGATANYSHVEGIPATAVPVPAVSENALLPIPRLMHCFSQQAHSFGSTGGFAPVMRFASPSVRMHDLLGFENSFPMQSLVYQASPLRRPQTTFPPPSPAASFASSDFSFPGGQRHLRPRFSGPAATRVLPGHDYAASPVSLRSQMSTLRSVAPTPTLSLQSRLRFIPPEVLKQMEDKASMKSVDNLSSKFDLVFTGGAGQDWMNHVNELERQKASRHKWLPRQFYFALSSTLSGKAKETLARLEKGLESYFRCIPTGMLCAS